MRDDLTSAVTTALEELPEVAVHTVRKHARVSDREVDLAIEGEITGRPVRLLVDTRAAGNPRDVHQAVRELVDPRRLDQPVADVPLFVAPVITQRS
ncbi:MAG: hypothetical protein IT307_05380 [Chloroflexi bacterium]|nr:hypothetical protein [Chloroflexota bacterium]